MFEPPFKIGDRIYYAHLGYGSKWVPCAFCAATGWITGAGGDQRQCPDCYGRRGKEQSLPHRWRVADRRLTVGMIEMKHRGSTGQTLWSYMCYETGIGSGSVYRDGYCFATEARAQAFCDAQNLAAGYAEEEATDD